MNLGPLPRNSGPNPIVFSFNHGRRHRRGQGTGPPQTFQRLALCLWTMHGKNRLQMVLVPPPKSNSRAVAPPLVLATILRAAEGRGARAMLGDSTRDWDSVQHPVNREGGVLHDRISVARVRGTRRQDGCSLNKSAFRRLCPSQMTRQSFKSCQK